MVLVAQLDEDVGYLVRMPFEGRVRTPYPVDETRAGTLVVLAIIGGAIVVPDRQRHLAIHAVEAAAIAIDHFGDRLFGEKVGHRPGGVGDGHRDDTTNGSPIRSKHAMMFSPRNDCRSAPSMLSRPGS